MTSHKQHRKERGWGLCLIFLFVTFLTASISRANENSVFLYEVEKALHEKLSQIISAEVEITGVRIVKGAEILSSPEPYAIKSTVMNGYSGKNKVTFLIALTNERKDSVTIVAEAAYDVPVEVFVTSGPLMSGSVLTEADFYAIKQKKSRTPAGALLSREELEGKVLKASLGQGIVLKTNHVYAQASGKRGQKVDIMVEGSNVSISTKGILRSDAVLGGAAKVWCDGSKKEIYGILVAPARVKVKI